MVTAPVPESQQRLRSGGTVILTSDGVEALEEGLQTVGECFADRRHGRSARVASTTAERRRFALWSALMMPIFASGENRTRRQSLRPELMRD